MVVVLNYHSSVVSFKGFSMLSLTQTFIHPDWNGISGSTTNAHKSVYNIIILSYVSMHIWVELHKPSCWHLFVVAYIILFVRHWGCQFVYRKAHSACTGDICKQNVWALYTDYISCIPYNVVCIHMCKGHLNIGAMSWLWYNSYYQESRLAGYVADQCS